MPSIPKRYWRSFVDPVTLAQQTSLILAPALPYIYTGNKAVVDKTADVLLEEGIKKLGSETFERANKLLKKISPKMSTALEKELINISQNCEDPKAKKELQWEITKLFQMNQDLAKEIESIINFDQTNLNQLALGNYENFFRFENPSGSELVKIIEFLDQKREDVANEEILSRYNPSELPYYSEGLKKFVTENRADELKKALVYIKNHRILLLSGVGGVGKSTLARALVDFRPVKVPEPFWFSFNQNQDATLGDILEKLAAYMKAPEIAFFKNEKREPGKTDLDKLTGELYKRSEIWLIFDDLHIVLDDTRFINKGIELLFSSLRYNTHNAKVIITSRILPELSNGESLIDVVEGEEKQSISGLKKEFAISYLINNGLDKVEAKKLEELAITVDGHPLALKLLVGLVKKFGVIDTLEDINIYQTEKEDTIKKARRIFDKLAGEEKEFLKRISIYREPVGIKALEIMYNKKTPKNAVNKLLDKSLLETNKQGNYWLHPLIKEFAYDELESKKEVHKLAFNFYNSLKLPEKPLSKEDIQPAIEAYHHAYMAEEYNLAALIIYQSNLYLFLDLWGQSETLVELYSHLLQEKYYSQIDKGVMGFLFGNLGLAYSDLGEIKKAIECYMQALKIAKDLGDKKGEENSLGNLGLAYIQIGQVDKAIQNYEQALQIAEEIGDIRGKGNSLGNIGLAYNQLGKIEKAIQYYKKALEIASKVGDKRGEGSHLGNLGNVYADIGRVEKAIEYYKKALKIAREIGDRRGEEGRLGNLGNVYIQLGKTEKAIQYYEKALEISKEIVDKKVEGNSLGNLGNAYIQLGKTEKAIQYYEQALQIAEEIGDIRGKGNRLGNLGNAYIQLGKTEKAIQYYEQALKIVKAINDRRGEGNSLGNLGNAYIKLGEFEKAIQYYEHALEISEIIRDPRGEVSRLGNLGRAYNHLGQIEKAIGHYEEALKISREIGDRRLEENNLRNLGNVYTQLGKIEEAIQFYEKALETARKIGDKKREEINLEKLGNVYSNIGQLEEATFYYEKVLEIAKYLNEDTEKGEIYNNRANISELKRGVVNE